MKKLIIGLGVTALLVSACGGDTLVEAPKMLSFESMDEKASYMYGYASAEQLKEAGINVKPEHFAAAIRDSMTGKNPRLESEIMQATSMAVQNKRREIVEAAARAKNLALAEAFLEKNGARTEVTQTVSGLQYEVLQKGSGPSPKLSDRVKAHYHGTLLDGNVFDSSTSHAEPVEFEVEGVIAGWTEVLQLMSVGDKWKVYVPSDLAYPNGTRSIGPGSLLTFEIELIEIISTE
ncbi:MAG: FKBP-type peptidyl-prolyl cis-trans isomerase FklB [Flavobacteriales bacterium]|jgi:FKBP-type peptidyl-prolyl cis-trans isomerase FklB